MMKRVTTGILVWMLIFSLSGMATSVHAGMIGTQELLESAEREKSIDNIRSFLERESVRDKLESMGVAPEEVSGRLATLTQSEIAEIEENLASMPAGGDALAVIGVVFVVLLILELVGVTNVFTSI